MITIVIPKSDDEILDTIMREFYNLGQFAYMPTGYFKKNKFPKMHSWDIDRLLRKLKEKGFIDIVEKFSDKNEILPGEKVFIIADKGIEMMKKYKGYLEYSEYEKRIENKIKKRETFDRVIKNGNIIAVILLSLTTVILARCPISNSTEQQQTKEGLQSVANKLDSLQQDIQHIQKYITNKEVSDTATSK